MEDIYEMISNYFNPVGTNGKKKSLNRLPDVIMIYMDSDVDDLVRLSNGN